LFLFYTITIVQLQASVALTEHLLRGVPELEERTPIVGGRWNAVLLEYHLHCSG
jgi:hypothetical protein